MVVLAVSSVTTLLLSRKSCFFSRCQLLPPRLFVTLSALARRGLLLLEHIYTPNEISKRPDLDFPFPCLAVGFGTRSATAVLQASLASCAQNEEPQVVLLSSAVGGEKGKGINLFSFG